MNIVHMKYAVEVARAGSINKASEGLLVAQPNLSRSIKELEAELGITIFSRTSKGMMLTPEGEVFIGFAQNILRQIDDVESIYKKKEPAKQSFSIAVPRSGYIADAFIRFCSCIGDGPSDFSYHEVSSDRAVRLLMEHQCNLGIIRYASHFDNYFKALLDEKGLRYELVAEFHYVPVMSKNHPLAKKEPLFVKDLEPYIEIAPADSDLPSPPAAAVSKEESPVKCSRHIYVSGHDSQFLLLSQNTEAFLWVSPLSEELLSDFGLVQKDCSDNQKQYRDMLIHRRDYRLSSLDKQFVTELCNAKRRCLQQ